MLQCVYEDDYFVVVNKPAGLSVNTSVRGLAGGAVEILRELRKPELPHLSACTRLERAASGLVVLAKTSEAASQFQEVSKTKSLSRRFIAMVRTDGTRKKQKAGEARPDEPALSLTTLATFTGGEKVAVDQPAGLKVHVRAALATMRRPVIGDAEFASREKKKPQTGRMFLHLERLNFDHPFLGQHVTLIASPPRSFDRVERGQSVLSAHFEAALASRIPILLDTETDAYRVISASADGVPGLVAERFGSVVVLEALLGKFNEGDEGLNIAAAWCARRLGVTTVYAKRVPRDRSSIPAEEAKKFFDEKPLVGPESDDEIVVREKGLNYLIKPSDGFGAGLFLDQRENRQRLREMANGKSVCNLFAYTCGFSVAAAAGGAESTANVDLAVKYLEWGKRCYAANKIDLGERHRFYASDVFEFFKRAERQKLKYDIVIVDPPTFSRSKKPARVFQVTIHLVELIRRAAGLLNKRGVMLVSTNHRELSTAWIKEQAKEAVSNRSFKVMSTPDVPIDFHGAREAAKSVWFQF